MILLQTNKMMRICHHATLCFAVITYPYVISRSFTKMTKRKITQTALHDSPWTYNFMMRKWQLLKVLLRLSCDRFALFVQ